MSGSTGSHRGLYWWRHNQEGEEGSGEAAGDVEYLGGNAVIYVIHFSRPFKHATHYIGYSAGTGEDRVERHQRNPGPGLFHALKAAGIQFEVTAVMPGDRTRERQLHRMKAASPSRGLRSICPLCRYRIRVGEPLFDGGGGDE